MRIEHVPEEVWRAQLCAAGKRLIEAIPSFIGKAVLTRATIDGAEQDPVFRNHVAPEMPGRFDGLLADVDELQAMANDLSAIVAALSAKWDEINDPSSSRSPLQ